MLKFGICIIIVYCLAKFINYVVALWQALPIKEEKSIPLYIKKEL